MDWNEKRAEVLDGVLEFAKHSPDSVKGYRLATGANDQSGSLGAKTRELISLAVAVTTRCDGCIAVHARKALEAGASRAEVSEALGVAIAMNAGAALAYSLRAMDAFEAG